MGQHHHRHLCRYIKIYLSFCQTSEGVGASGDTWLDSSVARQEIHQCLQRLLATSEAAFFNRAWNCLQGAKGGAWRRRDAKASEICQQMRNREHEENDYSDAHLRSEGWRGVHRGHRTPCLFTDLETACKLRKRKNSICGFFFFFYLHHVLLFTFLHHRQEEIMNFVATFRLLPSSLHLPLSTFPFLRRV